MAEFHVTFQEEPKVGLPVRMLYQGREGPSTPITRVQRHPSDSAIYCAWTQEGHTLIGPWIPTPTDRSVPPVVVPKKRTWILWAFGAFLLLGLIGSAIDPTPSDTQATEQGSSAQGVSKEQSAFEYYQSAVAKLPESSNCVVSMELDHDVPTVRINVVPSTWYAVGVTEYDKRKMTQQLQEAWSRCLANAGGDEDRAIVRLYDDTGTCVARGASFGVEVYE